MEIDESLYLSKLGSFLKHLNLITINFKILIKIFDVDFFA